ncbi:MAG: DNA translocase FtsK [Prolixibacteraceae bacterium]|nr:DNA translocase FtsK [Prolixibacteraceae bacterium]
MAEKKPALKRNNIKKTASKKGVKDNKPLRREQIKIISGFVLLSFSIYLLFAFGSFLFNAGADQSKLQLNWWELIRNPDIKVENITGKTGAWLADLFINQWFGLSSFLFIYLLGIYCFKLFNRKIQGIVIKTIKALVLIVWLSVTLGYAFETKYGTSSIFPGGMYGYYIAVWLNSIVGKVGTFFILLVSLFIYLVFVVEGFINIFKRSHKTQTDPEGSPLNVPSKSNDKIVEKIDLGDTNEEFEKTISPIDFDIDKDNDEGQANEMAEKNKTLNIEIDNLHNQDNGTTEDELEMTVEIKEQENEEYENKPLEDYDPKLDLSKYEYPSIDLLEDYSHLKSDVTDDELKENRNRIVETLRNFKIEIVKIKATVGPTVTLYEIIPAQGIRISKIKNLEDDIALSLSALGIRIIAPIPGRGTIGIEVPNLNPNVVSMRSIISSRKFQETTAELPIAMGRTISNETFVFDLTKMPHILVAGATGQGKSVGLNTIIASILYKKHPSQVKFVFIDPKKVELNLYASIEKHFLAMLPDTEEPIITDVEKVKATLNSVGIEMDNRYDLLKTAHARNIKEYNKKFIERKLNPEKGHRYLPYIIVIIDEFADLIMTAGKEIELPIARIAQLARAVGIHMVIATQRPSTNIITGVIKANFPSRIAFKVASMIDSRTILDHPGANQLIGKGDMLFASGSETLRLQCALVDTPEVERICEHIASQQAYPTAYLLPEYVGDDIDYPGAVDLNQKDEFFDDAARLVVLNQQGSTSMIQRKFSIGYNRAGRIMDQLEAAGVVGPSEGSKARRVLIQDEYSLEQLLNTL